jgi:uncharacterized protein YndB with AHSA1/START domain
MSERASTVVSRIIEVPPEAVYRAFLDPDAVATWLPPGSMSGIIHAFDAREGGAFSMSLVYPDDDRPSRGKTSPSTDTFKGRFETLVPNEKIVWKTVFDSTDPAFAGEMTVATTLEPAGDGTKVTITCENIPPGIKPEDNEEGCRASLEKLASFLGG